MRNSIVVLLLFLTGCASSRLEKFNTLLISPEVMKIERDIYGQHSPWYNSNIKEIHRIYGTPDNSIHWIDTIDGITVQDTYHYICNINGKKFVAEFDFSNGELNDYGSWYSDIFSEQSFNETNYVISNPVCDIEIKKINYIIVKNVRVRGPLMVLRKGIDTQTIASLYGHLSKAKIFDPRDHVARCSRPADLFDMTFISNKGDVLFRCFIGGSGASVRVEDGLGRRDKNVNLVDEKLALLLIEKLKSKDAEMIKYLTIHPEYLAKSVYDAMRESGVEFGVTGAQGQPSN